MKAAKWWAVTGKTKTALLNLAEGGGEKRRAKGGRGARGAIRGVRKEARGRRRRVPGAKSNFATVWHERKRCSGEAELLRRVASRGIEIRIYVSQLSELRVV